MILNIDENPNCEPVETMRFKTVGPPRQIIQVKIYDDNEEGTPCWITGWSDDPRQPRCPAYAQKVEDSGDGEAYLIYGGPWGLRLKPVSSLGKNQSERSTQAPDSNDAEWSLANPQQWGESFLIL